MIAEAILLQSPEYSKLAGFPVYVPGELKLKSLSFKKPVVIYASPANPGALALAKELQSSLRGLAITKMPPATLGNPARAADN